MKTNRENHLKPKSKRRLSRKGIALITVLSLLAITTLLIAAFFSLAKVELVSSDTYANGIHSRQLADTAVNIAMSQIKKATVPPAGSAATSTFYSWASQPGAIRKYDSTGRFYQGHKLYSDSNMVIDRNESVDGRTGEQALAFDAPDDDWFDHPERYVDLNAPVIRRSSGGEFDERFFPILDPRAAKPMTVPADPATSDPPTNLAPIKGFSYTKEYVDGTVDEKVVLPTAGGDFDEEKDDSHIPMPVEWLYTLQDGTIGFLDEDDGKFVGQGPGGESVPASLDNPIVGRIAFWTDDESTKININTASEPTFWNVPWLYSDVDYLNAMRQPGRREYQRYPGHPATTALSPVLFPDLYDNITPSTGLEAATDMLKDRKELIYGMVPRIGSGGSQAGTAEVTDIAINLDGSPANKQDVQAVDIDDDRLYSSLDELIFSTETEAGAPDAGGAPGETQRKPHDSALGLTSRTLQRAQFFLTANSRAPETNLFNMPRISIWPIHRQFVPREIRASGDDGKYDTNYGTGFDSTSLFCSTIGGVPYFFMREDADDPEHDLDSSVMKDNGRLFHNRDSGYLWSMLGTPFPGYGRTFIQKYGERDAHQIMTEVFDYIRCTNIHDDLVAANAGHENGYLPEDLTKNIYGEYTSTLRPDTDEWYTFTDPRVDGIDYRGRDDEEDDRTVVFPGHGQVTPIQVVGPGGPSDKSRGMGRFFTISEIVMHFICNADGSHQANGHNGVNYKNRIESQPWHQDIRDHLALYANHLGDPIGPIGNENEPIEPNPQTDPMHPEYKASMVENPSNLYEKNGIDLGGAAAKSDDQPYVDDVIKRVNLLNSRIIQRNRAKANRRPPLPPDPLIPIPAHVEDFKRPQAPDGHFWYSGFPPIPDHLNARVAFYSNANGNVTDPKNIHGALGKPNFTYAQASDYWKQRTPNSFYYKTKNPAYPGYDPANWNHNLVGDEVIGRGDITAEGDLDNILLQPDERLIQMMMNLETFCPSMGWTQIKGNIFVRVKGLDKFRLEGQQLFPHLSQLEYRDWLGRPSSTSLPSDGSYFFSSNNLIDGGGRGGANGIRAFLRSKYAPGRYRIDPDFGKEELATLPFEADSHWRRAPNGRRDYLLAPFISQIITVKGREDADPEDRLMSFKGGTVTFEIFPGHENIETRGGGAQPIQTFEVEIPDREIIQPQLVLYGTSRDSNSVSGLIRNPATAAPYWWTFNRNGCYGLSNHARRTNFTRDLFNYKILEARKRTVDRLLPNIKGASLIATHHERLRENRIVFDTPIEAGNPAATNPARRVDSYTDRGGRLQRSLNNSGQSRFDLKEYREISKDDRPLTSSFMRREDTIVSMVPWHGDYRHVLAAQDVKAGEDLFIPHLHFSNSASSRRQQAHNLLLGQRTNRIPGFAHPSNGGMFTGIGRDGKPYADNLWPDWPQSNRTSQAQAFVSFVRDFDTGFSNVPPGAYINKPDEGDTRIVRPGVHVPYITTSNVNEAAGPSYFSPNRQVASAGMFGSLPTGIKPGPYGQRRKGLPAPWMTLLFRPPVSDIRHPGERNQPATGDVPDHLLLDLFWMPVVEPYAVSEPLSTAGKINLNYQILPFTNIQRATGIHALLLGEKLLCYHKNATRDAHRRPLTGPGADRLPGEASYVSASLASGRWWDNTKTEWWRTIDVEETLRQFDDRDKTKQGKFDKGEIFRSASEICEVNFVPEGGRVDVKDTGRSGKIWRMYEGNSEFYFDNYKVTGDNARERPYTNVYPRVTTKSNSFQVHYRVQTIQKSNFTDPETIDNERDGVTSEFRGSSIIERYIDPNDPDIPDYREFRTKPDDTPSLDKFYRYRIVSTKRFGP